MAATTGSAVGTVLSGGSAYDAVAQYDQYFAGFADLATFGLSTKYREQNFPEVATQNHRGLYFPVSIDVEQSSQECNASDAVGDEVDRNVGEVNAKTYQTWVSAAIAECRETLEYLKQLDGTQDY